MPQSACHPSDETLLGAVDGELSLTQLAALERHLSGCRPCRARRRQLQDAAEEFLRACRIELEAQAPAGVDSGLRDRLQASVTRLATEQERSWLGRFVSGLTAVPGAALLGAALVALAFAPLALRHRPEPIAPEIGVADAVVAVEPGALPVRSLTPGATRPVRLDELCAGGESAERPISSTVRQAVLRDYRMEEVPAHEYELDYLITPELGGSADRLNLWPERYGARVWNARVKDELEHLLPQLVCGGHVDLATAQHDIAVNWIAAYKKYFRTERPLGTRAGLWRDDRALPMLVSLVTPAESIAPRPW